MSKNYDDETTLYVILKRDEDEIAKSYHKRLVYSDFKASIIHAFGHGIIMNTDSYETEEEQMAICKYYVQTVYMNIEEFVKGRHHCIVQLTGDDGKSFRQFLSMINAQGDREGACKEFASTHDEKQCHVDTKLQPQGGGMKVANVKV